MWASNSSVSQPVAGTNMKRKDPCAAWPRRARRADQQDPHGCSPPNDPGECVESLRAYLPKSALAGVLEEINRWQRAGYSCFTKLLSKLKRRAGAESVLDNLLPVPDD
jgi:hypothetical protein